MSAIRLSLGLENFHIFNKECENTFYMSAIQRTAPQI